MNPKCKEYPCGSYACDGGRCINLIRPERRAPQPETYDVGDLNIWAEHAMATQRDALAERWREVMEEAPGLIHNGKKGVFLDEAALAAFGGELGL